MLSPMQKRKVRLLSKPQIDLRFQPNVLPDLNRAFSPNKDRSIKMKAKYEDNNLANLRSFDNSEEDFTSCSKRPSKKN